MFARNRSAKEKIPSAARVHFFKATFLALFSLHIPRCKILFKFVQNFLE